MGDTQLNTFLFVSIGLLIACNVGYSQGTQHCLQCLKNEHSTFCNASSNLQRCSTQNEMCYTTVTNVAGTLFSVKGCILAQLCHVASSANVALCDQGVAENRCTYCCVGDACNYDRFRYSPTVTTLPTTTSTTTTTTTTLPALVSTVAPPSCKSENLTRCVGDYEEAVSMALSSPRKNFPYFCRQVPVMFQCVAEALSSCCPDNQLALHDQLTAVATTMWEQCPRTCDVNQGRLCTEATATAVVSHVIAGNATCQTLRTLVLGCQRCLVINVGVCGDTIRLRLENQLKVIKSATEDICRDPEPTVVPPATQAPGDMTTVGPTTRGPGCQPEVVEQCLVSLASNITLTDDPDYDLICNDLIPDAEQCLEEHSYACDADTKERLNRALNFTLDLMTRNCSTPTTETPLVCDTTAARACAIDIYRLIDEVGDFGLACSKIPETVECMLSNVTGCTEREKVSLNRTLDIVLSRLDGRCDKVVEVEGSCDNLTLEEGGEEKVIKFFSNYDPKVLCGGEQDCKVYVQLLFKEYASPKCRDGEVIPQVACRSDSPQDDGPPCSVLLTSDNWKKTHRLYLAATLDNKVDGDQRRELTLVYKKVVGGGSPQVTTVETCYVTVVDHDTKGQCRVLNDPHIQTFDGVKYDNMYEGMFVLYRHTRLPYEVHAFFQKCGRAGSCTCGMVVKSGDYVFVAEMCRRRKTRCGRKRGGRCRNLLKAKSYVWDEVTPGTRLFKRTNGFEVVLPHGTRVRAQHYKDLALIDVWVTPSAADKGYTTGLCGLYDGKKEKDLYFPGGDPYTGRQIGAKRQPRDFCKAWRIQDRSKMLHKGSPYSPYYPPEYCVCAGTGSCDKSSCDARHLVTTCDIDSDGEVSFDDVPTVKTADSQTRQKRAVDEDEFDFDLDYEPEEVTPGSGKWTEAQARTFCQAYLDGSNIVRLCKFQADVTVVHYVNICIQDILLSDDTKFAISALEGVKEECLNNINSDPKFAESDTEKHIVVKIDEANCPVECSNHGTCDQGKCQCDEEYVGASCDVKADAVPAYLSGDEDGLCDTRRTDCSTIVVYAEDVINSDKLTCHLTAVKVTESGVTNTSSRVTVRAEYFSSNQVLCRVQAAALSTGFYVDLSNDGVRVSGEPLLYVAHDPNCHTCQITDDGATCSRLTDSCVVEGACYAAGEGPRGDACSLCDPSHSINQFKHEKSLACLGPFVTIIIAVVVILVIIVLAVLVMYCCCKKKPKSAKYKSGGVENELIHR